MPKTIFIFWYILGHFCFFCIRSIYLHLSVRKFKLIVFTDSDYIFLYIQPFWVNWYKKWSECCEHVHTFAYFLSCLINLDSVWLLSRAFFFILTLRDIKGSTLRNNQTIMNFLGKLDLGNLKFHILPSISKMNKMFKCVALVNIDNHFLPARQKSYLRNENSCRKGCKKGADLGRKNIFPFPLSTGFFDLC